MDFTSDSPIPARLHAPLRALLAGDVSDWPSPLTDEETRALIEHGVAPLVYARVQPPELRVEAIRAAMHEPLRVADVAEVLGALAGRGVAVLIMKGTALAYDLYDVPEQRPRGDTDLLIAPRDVGVMREVMLSLGFTEQPSSGDEHALRQATFLRPPGMVYDVHWSATNNSLFDAVLHWDDLLPRSIALPGLGPHARGFSRVDALMMACVHRVAHHHDSDRLIWLVDIALLRDRMSREEHAMFWRQAFEGRVVAVCVRSIAVADAWCGRTPHDEAKEFLSAEELVREEPSRAFLDREITHGGVLVATMRALPWKARIERLRQLAFPPAEYMRTNFGTRNRLALPWLYMYRAMRGVARLFRRAR